MQRNRQKNMSNQKGASGKQVVLSNKNDYCFRLLEVRKRMEIFFPQTRMEISFLGLTKQQLEARIRLFYTRDLVVEVRVKKIEPAKHYDVISLARAMNDNFAQQTKELFSLEVEAVHEAMSSGIYVAWRPTEKPWNQQDCQRVCSKSRCFCGHLLNQHQRFDGKRPFLGCEERGCACQAFKFVPSRPEEVGEYWLVKRRDFDRAAYRVKCKCKHTHEQHEVHPPPFQCKAKGCGCSAFTSAFVCAACEKPWHLHETVIETEAERRAAGRQVGEAWMPFSELPELSKIALTGVDNPDIQTLADALPPEARERLLAEQQGHQTQLPGPSKSSRLGQ
ncbi:hypothetical protein T265_00820 [Opisthorchis viverrini]|uniref:Protein FAM221B n=2 Tax=Opisthorchis viverrini TaxID=6198 RepID=A0A075A1T2_OPIVI|nr:hypothetical protein T265_00820 [Opisthorchis viverrini]KER33326.1 hypothetical protein T265_00820 [Opisthorchis viverrini]